MSTTPKFVSLDRRSMAPLDDLVPARVSILRQIANHQHSLLSGWGGPPQARTCIIIAENGATASQVIGYRVPPHVTHADVSLLMQGHGTVTLTTSADATGTTLRSVSQLEDAALQNMAWTSTDGVNDDESAESGRALKLVTAAATSHQDVDVTVALDASGTDDLHLWAIVFRPVHVPR